MQRRALGVGLLLVLLWGASFNIQKAAYGAMGPGAFLFGRSVLMSLCAVALLHWRGSRLCPMLQRREWVLLLVCTLAGPFLHIQLVTYGVHWSTPFSGALIMACGPVFTLLLLRLLHGERLHPRQAVGVVVAFAGVLLFMSEKLMAAELQASGGDLLLLGATIVFSLYTIGVTPLVARHGGVQVMCWSTLLAAPLMLMLTVGSALQAPYAAIGGPAWMAFVWTVVVSGFTGWILWAWVNAARGVARTAPLLYLVPPVAGAIAWFTVGEDYSFVKIAGAVLALMGVAWTQTAKASTVLL